MIRYDKKYISFLSWVRFRKILAWK